MKIERINHKSLPEAAAGKLAASILDGSLPPGTQLPPERDLMNQLGISRSTLREALKRLEESQLIESRPHVGWFARSMNESNMAQAREMAGWAKQSGGTPAANEPPTGPLRVPIAPANRSIFRTCGRTGWAPLSSSRGGNARRSRTPR